MRGYRKSEWEGNERMRASVKMEEVVKERDHLRKKERLGNITYELSKKEILKRRQWKGRILTKQKTVWDRKKDIQIEEFGWQMRSLGKEKVEKQKLENKKS